jgi:hypothetical protein
MELLIVWRWVGWGVATRPDIRDASKNVELIIQSFLPGSHKTVRIHTRFVRSGKSGSNSGTTFEDVPGVEKNTENWDEAEGWKPAPVSPGSLVLIHGQSLSHSHSQHGIALLFVESSC